MICEICKIDESTHNIINLDICDGCDPALVDKKERQKVIDDTNDFIILETPSVYGWSLDR